MYTTGKIISSNEGRFTVEFELDEPWIIESRKIRHVGIEIEDGRFITPHQRNKIYALMGDISRWNGDCIKDLIDRFKFLFMVYTIDSGMEEVSWFSLSSKNQFAATITTARRFITYIIDFCIENHVPCTRSLLEQAEDITAYLYRCLLEKQCVICGQKAELHHWDAIGMGHNRTQINHIGMKAIALCRKHHTEGHTIGKETFAQKYKVFGIKINEAIAKVWSI